MGANGDCTEMKAAAAAASASAENNQTTDIESKVKKKNYTSNLDTAMHLFKGNVGAGLFAMGDCFKNGGLVGATLLMPVFAIISVHCEHMLIAASVHAVGKTAATGGATFYDYPETVRQCFELGPLPLRRFSKLMRLIVQMFLCVTQFGFCSIYFVFVTENLHQVLQQNGIYLEMEVVMSLCLACVMLPSLLTNLKYISPVSMFANFALLFGVISTLALAFKNGPMPSPTERHYFTNGSQMALFFGTALFSFEGIAVVLPLRNSMRYPEKFSGRFGVLNLTMILITGMLMFTGFVGYTRWGEDVEGSITLNLDVTDVFAQVIKIVAAVGVFFGYPIQFYVMIKIIWPPIKSSMGCAQKYPISAQVLLRFIMVLLTFGVASVVPQLGLFISLIGAMCSTCLAFVFPVVIDFAIRSQTIKGINGWVYFKNILILMIAALGIVMGTYQSIVEITRAFRI